MTSEKLKSFLDDIREAEADLNSAISDEIEANQQTQDILHAIEMDEYDHRRAPALVRTLWAVRKRRRVSKEAVERLTPIVDWSKENQDTIKSLERLLGTLRRTERHQEKRMYTRRTNILESKDLLSDKSQHTNC